MVETIEKLNKEKYKNQIEREKKELEDTYFLGSNNIGKTQKRKTALFKFVPWGIVLLIFSLAFFLISLKEKINIEVIISKKAPLAKPEKKAVSALTLRKFNNVFDREIVNNFRFYGGSKPDSRLGSGYLILVTGEEPDWAYMSVDFIRPIDFTKNSLIFSARGNKGKEELKIRLTDVNMRTFGGRALPVTTLTDKWQDKAVNVDRFDYGLDITKICRATFIFGSRLTNNKPHTTIYLKDITIVENNH